MSQFPQTPIGTTNDMLDRASEFVLRTNPKLTTNVKLITNGEKIWMESYNATKALSDSRYKSVKVSPQSSYGKDVVKFYNKLDKSAAYYVMEEYDSETVKDNYTSQYESFYWAGCERIDSLEYNEDIGMCAPLWISDKLPEMFIIFKIEEPSYFPPKANKKIPELDFRKDILDKCTIVRTFDLTENSPIGLYLRNYATKSGFPKAPITLSLDPDTIISYNGISYENGEFTSAQEHCHSLLYEHDDTILYLEKYITEGFERNGIICANLINLEFLFDDNTANDYTLNRYFGLYCNAISDAEFKVDCTNLVYAGNTYEGNPTMFSMYNQRNLTARNQEGVIIPTIQTGGNIGMPTTNDITDLDCVFCIRDIDNNMHNLSRKNLSGLPQNNIRLTDRTFKLSNLKGLVPMEKNAPCEYITEPASAQVMLTINEGIPPYTEIVLWNTIGGTTHRIGQITSGYLTDVNDNIIDQPGWYDNDMFYGTGGVEIIADAICNSFNKTFDVGLTAYRTKNNVIISAANASITYENMSISIENCAVQNCITLQNNGRLFGACPHGHLIIDESNLGLFNKGTYVRSKSKNGYALITGITQNITESTKQGNILNYENETKYNVITDEDVYGVTRNNTVETFMEYVPELCRLSFFPVTDFNYSTYGKSMWGEMGELDYEKSLIENTITQNEELRGIVELNELTANIDNSDLEIELDTNDIIVNADENTYEVSVTNTANPDEYDVLINFMAVNTSTAQGEYNSITKTGFNFSTLSTSLNKNTETYINNEYTRCYENYNASLMLLSKTQPWICKWVYKDGTDVRTNPYRLNTSPAFGQLSFSPDHRSFEPDPNLYNQEWGYIFDEIPHDMILDANNIPINDWTKIWSYIGEAAIKDAGGSIYDNNVERNLKRTDEDWFDTYFKRDYYNTTGIQTDTLDHIRKYSLFDNGTKSVSSTTFFMGAEIELIEKLDWEEHIDNNIDNIKKQFSGNMNGYRFTAVLVPISVTDATSIGDIKAKVIKNDVFKFVVLIIYIVKQYYDAIDVIKENNPENYTGKSISIETINRYVMYNPTTNIINSQSETTPITMKGSGYITDISMSDTESLIYEIHGSNTNFTNDFIPYTENNEINGNTYEKQLLIVKYYYTPSPIKMYYVFTITNVESDTLMYAKLADVNSTEEYDTYNVLRNAIPNWLPGNHNNMPTVYDEQDTYFICNCDYAQFANELNRSVFGSIYHDINVMQSENVIYELIDQDGNFHTSDSTYGNPEYPYAIMFVKPNDSAKYNYLTMLFNGQYITYATQPDSAFPMLRHDGLFTPHRTEILKYKDPYIEKITGTLTPREERLLESSRHLNTCFASDYNTFAKIFNLAFHRANDRNSNVYRLKDGDKPLYPIENKFSIGARTYNIFNSPWDPYHYTTTLSETNETNSHGTLSMKEHKSFLSTTTMKTPDTITLDTFITSDTSSDNITCLYEIKNTHITFDVFIEKRLIEYFTNELTPLFNIYVDTQYSYGDKTTLSDDIESYIRENLLSLYQLSEITFYTKEVTNPTQSFNFSYMNQPDSTKEANGLKISKTIGISTMTDSNFNRHIVFNTKQKRQYSFGISVKITRR